MGDAYARITYFFYTKILHELAHACLAELGRSLLIEDKNEQFSSLATHGLARSISIQDTETRAVTLPLRNLTFAIENHLSRKDRMEDNDQNFMFYIYNFFSSVTYLSPKAPRICTFLRLDTAKAPITSDDEADQPILNANGKLRYPAILHKT